MTAIKLIWGALSMLMLIWALNSHVLSYIAEHPYIIALLLIYTFVTANMGLSSLTEFLFKKYDKTMK